MNETETQLLKAASAGFAQSLINNGYDQQTVAALTTAYAHPTEGALCKRASNINMLQTAVAGIINAIRSNG